MLIFNQFGNQFSYVLFGLGATVGMGFILWRLRARWPVIFGSAAAVAVLFIAGWFILRPGAPDVDSADAAEAVIQRGAPTLIEFYSNYCAGCIAVRGAVEQLILDAEDRFGDQMAVLRVDIHTDTGRALRERYGFSYTPEFVLFNRRGSEVWRSHAPPTVQELETIAFADTAGRLTG